MPKPFCKPFRTQLVYESALAAAHIDQSSLLLYIGLTLGSQRVALYTRARRPGQVADSKTTKVRLWP